MIGNDPFPISLNVKFHDMYVFNQIYHMQKHSFPCPTRIFHLWNHLFPSKVRERHRYIKQRCPDSISVLKTLSEMNLSVSRIQNFSSLSPRTIRCFQSFNRNGDGHPWTLGFHLTATLVQRRIRPHVINL